MSSVLLLLWTTAILSSLYDCTNDGPWACEEEGCPEPYMGCDALAKIGCAAKFSDIWATAPSGTAGARIMERCPQACGRCGLAAPLACNMAQVDATDLDAEGLAQLLLDAEAPVVIRGAMPGWQTSSYPQLLAAHAETPVEVITSGGTCMRRSRHAYRLEYTHALLL